MRRISWRERFLKINVERRGVAGAFTLQLPKLNPEDLKFGLKTFYALEMFAHKECSWKSTAKGSCRGVKNNTVPFLYIKSHRLDIWHEINKLTRTKMLNKNKAERLVINNNTSFLNNYFFLNILPPWTSILPICERNSHLIKKQIFYKEYFFVTYSRMRIMIFLHFLYPWRAILEGQHIIHLPLPSPFMWSNSSWFDNRWILKGLNLENKMNVLTIVGRCNVQMEDYFSLF